MKHREKDDTRGTGQRRDCEEFTGEAGFSLRDPSPLQFGPFDKNLYRHIKLDLNARVAFEKMTSGRRAIDSSVLLLWLSGEACSLTNEQEPGKPYSRYANESEERRKWEKWNDALDGLKRNAKTLRRVSSQMKRHLAKGRDLPGETNYSMSPPRGQIYQALFTIIPQSAIVLSQFAEKLQECSETLKAYCSLGRVWRQVAAKANEVEIQRTFSLLHSIKDYTGRCQFEKMAPLISVGRRLSGRGEETAESLRSVWRRQLEKQKRAFEITIPKSGRFSHRNSRD